MAAAPGSLAHDEGPWRVTVEGGTGMGILWSADVRGDVAVTRAGQLTFLVGATAAIIHSTGISWGGAGPSSTGRGAGPTVGVEGHPFSPNLVVGVDAGALIGDWDVLNTSSPPQRRGSCLALTSSTSSWAESTPV